MENKLLFVSITLICGLFVSACYTAYTKDKESDDNRYRVKKAEVTVQPLSVINRRRYSGG